MIRLLVCDDHDLMRAGLVAALQGDGRFVVVAEARSAAALQGLLADGAEADVLLLDLSLGTQGAPAGLALIEAVHRERPGLSILVVSMHDDAELVGNALRAGALGYVTKDSSLPVLIDAILHAQRGHHYLAPVLVEPALKHQQVAGDAWDAALTPRERAVLTLVCSGKRLSEIAAEWGVSIKTVSTHKMRLMDKLGVSSNAALIQLGLRHGLS